MINLVNAEKVYDVNNKKVQITDKGINNFDVQLIYHSTQCVECSDIWKITIKEKDTKNIISDISFEDIKKNREKKLLNYKLEVKKNNTWIPFDEKELKDLGEYYIKLTGYKNKNEIIDYIPSFMNNKVFEWAIWGITNVYDEINDNQINRSLWTNGTSVGDRSNSSENADYLLIASGNWVSSSSGSNYGRTTLNFSRNLMTNLTFRVVNSAGVKYSAASAWGLSQTNLFGNNIQTAYEIDVAAGGSTNDTIFDVYRNLTAGSNKWDVFANGVYVNQITATNDLLEVTTSYVSSGANYGLAEAYIYYVYYSVDSSAMDITLNNPVNDSENIITPINFNISTNLITSDLKNVSLFINSVQVNSTNWRGSFNNTVFKHYLAQGTYFYYARVCDLSNNCKNSEIRNFDVVAFRENSQTYNNNTLTGNIENFGINITIDPTYLISSAKLNYNNTLYSADSIISDGTNYLINKSITVSVNSNISFYWSFVLTDGNTYNSTIHNQTISPFTLSNDCSAGTFPFINITNYDEEDLSLINGTVEYLLTIQSSSINGSSYGTNFSICSNLNLTGSNVSYDLQLRYYSNDYKFETYNIKNSLVSNLPIEIDLYYLNDSIGTEFKINYLDFYYLTYPSAIIQIQRQDLFANIYRIVEIPMLDNNGKTTGSFNTNNIRYKLIVINNGVVLDTFDNIFPSCQNIVLGTCEINLRGAKSTTTTTIDDFTYNLLKTNNSLILTYVIPSGTPRNINFLTNQYSPFIDSISTCNVSTYASGGTLTCNYNQTVGDSIIDTEIINSDGSHLYGKVLIKEDLSGFFLYNNFFISFIILLTLGLMFISSGFVMIIVAVVGIIYLGFIFLIRGVDIVTLTGSIGFLVVAAGLIIYKIAKKEEKT